MVKTDDGYGPDNPRNWDPNHPQLRSPLAPHETSAVMRAQRAGYRGTELVKLMRMPALKVVRALEKALDEEGAATRQSRPIHDSLIEKGTK